MAHVSLHARHRETLGKRVKALRRTGILPANLYGPKIPSQPLELDAHAFSLAERHITYHTPVDLTIEGSGSQTVEVQRIQRNPRTGLAIHLELLAR